MGDHLQSIINNEEWRKEKLDFICSVVSNVDQDSLLAELHFCETNEDAEGLMQSLILVQERSLEGQSSIPQQEPDGEQFPVHNDIIVRLPEEQGEGVHPLPQPQDVYRDLEDNENGELEDSSDSDDSCYFTPDIFNSSQTEQNEADELTATINNVDVGGDAATNSNILDNGVTSDDNVENSMDNELAQAIAESNETAQAQAEVSEKESRIMSQVSILASLFSDADPDFLQERIEQCMKLEGDEERFQAFVEANLELKTYPKMKDYLKRQKQAQTTPNDVDDFDIIEDTQVLAENLSIECGICLEENILGIDTSTCSAYKNEHTYCNQCIKRYVEAQIGQGLSVFKCMEGYCSAEFSLRMLKKLIDPPVFAKLCERRQQEEIAASGLENLESCPFCPYMVSMPNEDDKIFKCLNPDCLIDSCRKCKEPSHIPFRCEEIEKKPQMNARTFLENEMAEAMIRECPKCKKRFIIEAGCNRMTCPCGAVMCYICKQLIDTVNGDGYSHFERGPFPSDKCPLYSDAATLHAQEVRGAAERAKQDLDPQVALVHDPTRNL
ncbi:hypothetical protein SK128_014878 [Halocaridina rubra]|uniref:RING-type domain-containing protein n=1 Tax=Halocaridina rubra TaxID=373956 RepID=A0AAN8ZR59_HALRR